MNIDSKRTRLSDEHVEFAKDLRNLVISLTPVSNVISVSAFFHKWVLKKRGVHKVVGKIKKYRRKQLLKSRARRA
ncbi:MAG: hypothetical protein KGI06_05710 [Candidatus Micrarchaeota archaeon]|nr:hypothetical protein [Candidatus Micrarchaeota archaeon]